MISTLLITTIVTLATVHADIESLVGRTTTLSAVGLKAENAKLKMVRMENMDLDQQQSDDDDDEMEKLVANGMPTYPGMFQFQASLMVNTSRGFFHICGAILLSNRHALTAAHCTPYMSGNVTFDHFLAVAVHNWTLGLLNPGSQMVKITHAENHGNFPISVGPRKHDISMLYFDEDIVENKYVKFAELATPEMGNFEKELCVVSGWGVTAAENIEIPDILQFAYQYIPTKVECRNFWAVAGNDRITDWQICGHYYPTSGCFGDSGGPLTCGNVVVGIVSWGLSSCSGCFPVVYTRVSKYTEWIARNKI